MTATEYKAIRHQLLELKQEKADYIAEIATVNDALKHNLDVHTYKENAAWDADEAEKSADRKKRVDDVLNS